MQDLYWHIDTINFAFSFYKGHMQQFLDAQKGDEEAFVLDLFYKWCVRAIVHHHH